MARTSHNFGKERSPDSLNRYVATGALQSRYNKSQFENYGPSGYVNGSIASSTCVSKGRFPKQHARTNNTSVSIPTNIPKHSMTQGIKRRGNVSSFMTYTERYDEDPPLEFKRASSSIGHPDDHDRVDMDGTQAEKLDTHNSH